MPSIIFNKTAHDTETCPNCQASWIGEEIFPVLRKQAWTASKSDDELRQHIEKSYGPPPHRFGTVIGIEYAYNDYRHRDGISAYQCPDCRHIFPRDLGSQSLSETEVQCAKRSL